MFRYLYPVVVFVLTSLPCAAATNTATTSSQQPAGTEVLSKTPGDFLPAEPFKGSTVPGYYNEIPANLEPAIRLAAEDNYSSSTPLLKAELDKAKDPKEKARVLMWLGITLAQQAKDYDAAAGWYGVATTATAYLREATKLDPEVFKACDAARSLGEMIGSGWAPETPESEMDRARKRGEADNDAVQFFYAGVMLKQVTVSSWGFANTQQDDEKTLGYFARAVVRDPGRYELWPSYLSMLARLGLKDLLTSDGMKMYTHFKSLGAPLFVDQGPAALFLRTRTDITEQMALEFLAAMHRERPTDPYPPFHRAQITMATKPAEALEQFKKFYADVEAGTIKLAPREQGYRISALYKQAFLEQALGMLEQSLKTYDRVVALSPTYAETHYNRADTYLKLAELETTGPAKLALLEKSLLAARRQAPVDYQGRAASKTETLRKQISSLTRRVKAEIEKPGAGADLVTSSGATTTASGNLIQKTTDRPTSASLN